MYEKGPCVGNFENMKLCMSGRLFIKTILQKSINPQTLQLLERNFFNQASTTFTTTGKFNRKSFFHHRRGINMDSGSPLVLRLVAASVAAANDAGNIVRDIMKKGDLGIVEKTGINDLQTEADRAAQRAIVGSLSHQFPNITIIGEEELVDEEQNTITETGFDKSVLDKKCPESLLSAEEKDVVIWVDPLDGTKEYTEGYLDHVTVLIGISVDGKSVAGVIHQPFYNFQAGPDATLGRTMWGVVGIGVYGVEQQPLSTDKRIITTTRSHMTPEVQGAINAMEPDDVLRVGGAGHKVLLLIEGRAHCYLFASPGCKKWDTCAPQALLEALGGRLTDIHGNHMQYHKDVKHQNSGGVLASCRDHDWYLARVPESIKDKLLA